MNYLFKRKQLIRLGHAAFAGNGLSSSGDRNDLDLEYQGYTDPNHYSGSDVERINQAIAEAKKHHGFVRIFPRRPDSVSNRNFWLLDSAILVPGNTTLILENCRLKLSDQSRDNFIRSANCVPGAEKLERISHVHIIGRGSAILEGADHPRSTGDGKKILGVNTYGTDAGKEGVSQYGDWRNIGILLAETDHFTLENLIIHDSHAWAISLEHCSNGRIRNIDFSSYGWKMIDGKKERILNQDGLDLRTGCHDIIIENITGVVGDDLIAVTALHERVRKTGIFPSSEFTGKNPVVHHNNIRNIIIRNVKGYSAGLCNIVRILNTGEIGMDNILLDGLLDTSPEDVRGPQAVKIGDSRYGKNEPGSLRGFIIRNLHTRTHRAVLINQSLRDSIISGVISENPDREIIELVPPADRKEQWLIFDSLLKTTSNNIQTERTL